MGVEGSAVLTVLSVDEFKNLVGRDVSASTFPPALDNPLIVSIDSVVCLLMAFCHNCEDEEEGSDTFCPADVSLLCLPCW